MRFRRRWIIFLSVFRDPREVLRHFLLPAAISAAAKYAPFLVQQISRRGLKFSQEEKVERATSAYGNFSILTNKAFYKMGLSGGVWKREWEGYLRAQASPWRDMLPRLSAKRMLFWDYYRIDRLAPGDEYQAEAAALQVLESAMVISRHAKPAEESLRLAGEGLRLIEKFFPLHATYWRDLFVNLRDYPTPIGWVHGDLHPKNLLFRQDGSVCLIDWDCVRENGVIAWDWVHFLVTRESMRRKENWYDSWLRLTRTTPAPGGWSWALEKPLLFGYFLHRVGQERSYYKYPEFFLSGIERSLQAQFLARPLA